jgi:hypothetical protein
MFSRGKGAVLAAPGWAGAMGKGMRLGASQGWEGAMGKGAVQG